MKSSELIELAGGTAEVARICKVTMSAVSQWKNNGIPKLQQIILALYLEQKGITRKENVLPKELSRLWEEFS